MTACISGWAMLHRTPAIVPDIFEDARIPLDAYRPTFVKSLVMVPIREASPIGAIGVYWATPRGTSASDVALLQALANTTAVALENVQVYQELEDRVRQRTAQLEAANRELDAFSHSVSHDLRAPLRHITSFTRIVQEEAHAALSPESRSHLDRVVDGAERMSRLIESLLSFARLGRRPLATVSVDFATLVRDCQQETLLEAPERAVEWQLPPSPIPVVGDAALLRQVVLNLLSNALKYTRGRTPARIEVGLEGTSADGFVTLFVRDNGAGFDPTQASRLFGVFERLHSQREFEGVGVGLANVRRIVERHGGRAWADGSPDQGATFWFTLPARPQSAQSTSHAA